MKTATSWGCRCLLFAEEGPFEQVVESDPDHKEQSNSDSHYD